MADIFTAKFANFVELSILALFLGMCNKPLFLACVIIQKQPIVVNGWAVRELTLLRANVGKHGMHIICTQHFHNCSQTHNSLARPTPLNDSRSNKSHTLATTHPIYASLRHQTPNYCNKDTIQSLSTYASLHIRDQLIETKPPFNHCQRTHHSTSEKTKATKPPINHCQQSVTINTTGAKSLLRPEQGCVRWRPVEGETSYS